MIFQLELHGSVRCVICARSAFEVVIHFYVGMVGAEVLGALDTCILMKIRIVEHGTSHKDCTSWPQRGAILKRDAQVISHSMARQYPLVFRNASGVNLWDVDGNRYLD